MKPHIIGRQMLSLLAVAGILLLVGCDPGWLCNYRVKNNTGQAIKVYSTKYFPKNQVDSIVIPASADTVIFYYHTWGREAVDFETGDTLSRITGLSAYKSDTQYTTANLLKRNRWVYTKEAKIQAKYTLTITNADF